MLYADDILEKERKTCQCSKCQLDYIVLGWTYKNWEPKWREISSKGCYIEKPDNVNSKLDSITDELIMNIENSQFHESGLITKHIITITIGYGGFRIPVGSSYISLPFWIKIFFFWKKPV